MKSDSEMLDEVMVVAYGTAKKSQFTGSASTVKADKIAERQVSNVTNALSGQVAGVQTMSSNGQPGTGSTVRIRGVGSMSASNSPLYVVDGIPYDGDISFLNSQDIESMTVLKDAASNALYGARGANGVILVTTKKGSSGKAQVNVDAKWGTNRRAVPNYNVMTDPGQYVETYYTALLNGLGDGDPKYNAAVNNILFDNGGVLGYPVFTVPKGEMVIGADGKLNPNATLGAVVGDYFTTPDNWYDEMFDKGNLRQEYNINISGAGDKMNYYFSAGYLDDSGIIPNSSFTRFSSRLKADYQVQEWLKVGANMAYSNVKTNNPDSQTESGSSLNLFYVANTIAPIYPMYVRDAAGNKMTDSRGFTIYDYGNGTLGGLNRPFLSNSNPASALQLDKTQFTADVFSGKAFAEIQFFEGLKATANWGVDVDNTRYFNYINPYYGQYSAVGGVIAVGQSRTYSVNQQYLLTYVKSFGEHNIDVLAGFENYRLKAQSLSGSKQNMYNPGIHELNNAINNPSTSSSTGTYATQGFLARAQYNYADKYYASLSFRRDASSRFHPDNRWGNFWSVGLGWLLNKENFLADASWIDMLKFKISYGEQGNDAIGNDYAYLDQYTVANSNNDFSVAMSYKGNKDLTWETSHSFNTGFDFEFFKGRLSGTVEYFSRKTTDMLYNKPMPITGAGYGSIPMNVGSMVNNGVELDVKGDIISTNDIVWSANFNMTHLKNKIKKLHPDLKGEMISGSYVYREGESVYQLYLRSYAGVDHETGEALYYKDVLDANNNVTGRETTTNYAEATQYGSGDLMPSVYGGFGTALKAYGFDVSIALAYQLGGTIYDNTYSELMHSGTQSSAGVNWHKDILNAWTPENKDSNIPRINFSDKYANALSDRFLVSSDYLSIQNITAGYTLPKSWTRKMMISTMRLYIAVDNVALFSARKGLDPRQGYAVSGNYVYSPIRTISGGITLSF